MAVNALNTLAKQYGPEALKEAFKLWTLCQEHDARTEVHALHFPNLLIYQSNCNIKDAQKELEEFFRSGKAPEAEAAKLEEPKVEEPKLEEPKLEAEKPRRRSSPRAYRLASEETIEQIIKNIDDGQLRSNTKSVSWKAKHYPSSTKPMEILSLLRVQEDRTATKEQLLQGLSHWSWTNATGNPYTLSDYMRELLKQGIVISI
jgi:hypothetical protein